jgi:hypothetical protein
MAVPPLAETLSVVTLATSPPSTPTDPQLVSPTPMALPALPPLLTSPSWTAPPLAEDVATPPFPADAVSVNCMMVSPLLCPPSWGEPPRIAYGIQSLKPIARKSRMSPKRGRAQDEDDATEGSTVRGTWAAALRLRRLPRQQRFDGFPEIIGDKGCSVYGAPSCHSVPVLQRARSPLRDAGEPAQSCGGMIYLSAPRRDDFQALSAHDSLGPALAAADTLRANEISSSRRPARARPAALYALIIRTYLRIPTRRSSNAALAKAYSECAVLPMCGR